MPSPVVRGLVVLVGLATVSAYVGMFVLSTTRNRPDHLDVEPVRSTAAAACTQLRVDVDALPPLPPTATPGQRQERVGDQLQLLDRLVAQVRAVGPEALAADEPALDWLEDWAALRRARQAWADAGATGPFTLPLVDGRPLPDRMASVGVEPCLVPTALTIAP